MGLVEVLVALVITGVVLSALAQTLIGSFRSVAVSEQRLRATQVASEAIEDIQALEWDDIGLYGNPAPPTPVVDGHSNWTVVNLGTTPPANAPPNLPLATRTVVLDGVSHTVDTAIVWDDVPPTSAAEMVRKRLQVTVSWTSRDRTRQLQASSFVSMPGSSVQPTFFYMLVTSAGAAYQLIDDNGTPVTALGVTVPVVFAVETNRAAAGVTAAWTNRTGAAAGTSLLQTVNAQTFARTEYSTTFVNGPTTFTFTASPQNASYATDTQSTDVTFLHRNVYSVAAPTVTSGLSGADICLRTLSSRTYNTLTFSVGVQGFLTPDSAILANGVFTVPGVTSQTTTRGVIQTITIPDGTTLVHSLGQATFTLTSARTSALPSGAHVRTFSLPVKLSSTAAGC